MKNHTIILFILILLIGCFGSISSDIYAPSLPFIAKELNTSIDSVQLSMAIFLFGSAISQLFYGPISEAFGRKPPIILGLILASVGSLICIFSYQIGFLILGRLIQGLGAGSLSSLWRTIFRDTFSGKELARMGSYLVIIVSLFIPAAPLLGGYLQYHFQWEASFIFLFFYSLITLIMFLTLYKESHKNKSSHHLNIKTAIHHYLSLLKTPSFLGNSLCSFLCYGAFFSWYSTGPVLIIKILGMSSVTFGWITFIGGSVSMMLGGIIYNRLIKKYDVSTLLLFGLSGILFCGLLMLILYLILDVNLYAIIIPVSIFYFMTSFIWPSLFVGAFQEVSHIAGYAGCLYSLLQIGGGAFFTAIIGSIPDTNQIQMICFMIISPLLCFLIYKILIQKK